MKWLSSERVLVAVSVMSAFGLAGCVKYNIETTLEADGSGARREEMVVDAPADSDESGELENQLSSEDFEQLMSVGRDAGWEHSSRVDGSDTVHVFERETRVRDLAAWSELSGKVHIAGATSASAGSSVGLIKLGDVHFRNSVQVESGSVPGGRSYSFRETFYWENVIDALVEWYARYVDKTVASQYPELTAKERGEIAGLVKGGLWSAVDQGLLDTDGEEQERLMSAFIERAAEQSMKIIRRRHPSADETAFAQVLRQIYEDDQNELAAFISTDLPGVELAANSEIVYRLEMPGRVTDSNAHTQDGTTLIWRFGPGDAVTAPVEIFARSVVDRQ